MGKSLSAFLQPGDRVGIMSEPSQFREGLLPLGEAFDLLLAPAERVILEEREGQGHWRDRHDSGQLGGKPRVYYFANALLWPYG
ncbi:MAG TPA: hypothetical protein EYP85_08180 [Armatimonadetes bacterium]|nr:hypothetical protein [Armatimonadota bacterium]